MANQILPKFDTVSQHMARQTIAPGGGVFATQIAAFAAKTKLKMDLVVKSVLFDISASLVKMSPVGNREMWAVNIDRAARGLDGLLPKNYVGGRFRANWMFGSGSPPEGIVRVPEPNEEAALAKLQADMGDIKAGNVHYIVNNLPYAIPLEYGWSTQAPNGMVRVTMGNVQGYVTKAAGRP